jgi:hypothetical protein
MAKIILSMHQDLIDEEKLSRCISRWAAWMQAITRKHANQLKTARLKV